MTTAFLLTNLFVANTTLLAVAPAAPAAAQKAAYDDQFNRAFPVSGDAHRIESWETYVALASDDIIGYAQAVDPVIAKQAAEAKGKPYQTKLLERAIRDDATIAGAFSDQRRRLQSMAVTANARGFGTYPCQHALAYVDGEFRLILGEGGGHGASLSRSIIAPGCPSTLDDTFQLTAGASPRFMCWASTTATRCGWRLTDMPLGLKAVVESRYPESLALRWRWRGLGKPLQTPYVDDEGNRVAGRRNVTLSVPSGLSLDFVDEAGKVVWSATTK